MEQTADRKILLQARDVCKWFPINGWFFEKKRYVQAVDHISFDLYQGETLGLVGESGCGKTTLARTVLRLIEPTGGQILFDGKDLMAQSKTELRALRKDMQIVFQDPYSSLHPRMSVRQIIEEPMRIRGLYTGAGEREKRVKELLNMVGLNETHMDRYPHEFSGGQRQRIVIARALATEPKLIICDEPVSALDVSVRAQILNLLRELQEKLGLTYLFISHDLSVVEHLCDRVAIMYLGQMVELGSTDAIFSRPLHPYTKALLSAAPQVGRFGRRDRMLLEGDIPSPADPPSGCRFRTRCPYATDACAQLPQWEEVESGHSVLCHRFRELEDIH
ncbi:ABC transporter ATP-binding protein [Pseudoflavonifractor sp. HCP28S3_F10]|uniref:ABC transporter ATP-binding protein n=1 Tax=Pseudoflavonifractor sp. HCP28S3_F10 TaxID=3438947 RepID=UPI003F8BC0D2